MPSLLPTQIEQVNDFSFKAAKDYIDLLGQPQNNWADILGTIVNKATDAAESQRMTDALSAFQRGLENGQRAGDILKTLDPRITGSREFQDRAGELRDDRIRQTAEDRAQALFNQQMRQARLQEDASTLLAEAMEFDRRTNGLGAGIFLNKNAERLQANPYAYKDVMNFYATNGRNVAYDPTAPAENASAINNALSTVALDSMASAEKGARAIKSLGSYLGIDMDPESMEALKHETLDSVIASEGKARNYTGQDYSDFAENMRNGYVAMKAAVPGLPEWAYLAALKTNMESGTWSWIPFAGRFDQDQIDTDTGVQWLRQYQAVFPHAQELLATARRTEDALKQARDNKELQNAVAATNTTINLANTLYQQNKITEADRNSMINNAIKTRDTALANIQNTINEQANATKFWNKLIEQESKKN